MAVSVTGTKTITTAPYPTLDASTLTTIFGKADLRRGEGPCGSARRSGYSGFGAGAEGGAGQPSA